MEELLHSLYHSARIRLGDDMVIISYIGEGTFYNFFVFLTAAPVA